MMFVSQPLFQEAKRKRQGNQMLQNKHFIVGHLEMYAI